MKQKEGGYLDASEYHAIHIRAVQPRPSPGNARPQPPQPRKQARKECKNDAQIIPQQNQKYQKKRNNAHHGRAFAYI
eukprot:3505297-Rhodomonas_salina.1